MEQPDWLAGLQQSLAGVAHVEHLAEVASTNTLLKQRVTTYPQGEPPQPVLLIADRQLQGRGTRGRTWLQASTDESCAQDIALSLLCPLAGGLLADPRLSLCVGALVIQGLRDWAQRTCPDLADCFGVKWPNDILAYVDGHWRKLGGLLLESCSNPAGQRWVVIGLGLNVLSGSQDFPAELRPNLTTLRELASGQPAADQPGLLGDVLQAVAVSLVNGALQPATAGEQLLDLWFSVQQTAGTRYVLTRGGHKSEVVATGVERSSGHLRVVDRHGGEHLVSSYTELDRA